MTKLGKMSAAALLMLGLATPAVAGPQMTFGPEDKGKLQLDYKGQFQMIARDTGSGTNNDDTTATFNFRRNRIALMGAYGDNMSLYVQTEFSDETSLSTLGVGSATSDAEFQILDAVARFKFNDGFRVNAGKFKYGFSRENLEACENPLSLDRSLFVRAPFVATRDMGVGVWGNLFNDVFQYRLDVMEGRKAVSGDTAPESNFRYTMRAHLSLLDPETDYGYKGTYLGKKKALTVGAAYQLEPKVAYSDTVSRTGEKDYSAWTVDGFFEYPLEKMGTVSLSAAYADYDLDDAYKGANPDSGTVGLNGEKNGWYAKAAYMLPETPLQFFGRYEKWRFAELNNIFDQQVDWLAFGANYYIWGQNLKLTAEYAMTKFDKEGVYSGAQGASLRSKDFDTFIAQLQVLF